MNFVSEQLSLRRVRESPISRRPSPPLDLSYRLLLSFLRSLIFPTNKFFTNISFFFFRIFSLLAILLFFQRIDSFSTNISFEFSTPELTSSLLFLSNPFPSSDSLIFPTNWFVLHEYFLLFLSNPFPSSDSLIFPRIDSFSTNISFEFSAPELKLSKELTSSSLLLSNLLPFYFSNNSTNIFFQFSVPESAKELTSLFFFFQIFYHSFYGFSYFFNNDSFSINISFEFSRIGERTNILSSFSFESFTF